MRRDLSLPLLLATLTAPCGCEESISPVTPAADDAGAEGEGEGAGEGEGEGAAGADAGPDAGGPPSAIVFDAVGEQSVPVGFPLSLRVSATHRRGLTVALVADELPFGAEFAAATGTLSWVPSAQQLGDHLARFSARAGGDEARLTVPIHVFSPAGEGEGEGEGEGGEPGCEPGHPPCGNACCEPGALCLFGACVVPGGRCDGGDGCGEGERCDPVLGRCVPAGAAAICEFVPPVGEFSPVVGCRWTPPEDQPRRNWRDVVMAPVVANLTDDNGDGLTDLHDIPDIVFSTYNLDTSCCNTASRVRVVSGRCASDGSMRTLATLDEIDVDNSAGLALGDLDGDGVPEIVAMQRRSGNPQGTVAFRRTADDGSAWEVLWRNNGLPRWNRHTRGAAQPALADLDGDGTPEVVVGNVALSGADGTLVWDGFETAERQGGIGNNAFLGPVSVVGDVDLDGRPEVAAGNTLYSWDGRPLWTFEFPFHNSPCGGDLRCDGFTAMADFDADPQGEVVIVRRGAVFVLQHTGELLWGARIPRDNCANNEAGPPTVADFDGDGRPEIGTAAADYYVVADPDCTGQPLPEECDSEGILWKVANFDCSSRVTASSVFDFEGDGQAEVVYADERTLRIFRGADGSILYEDDTHGSHTRLEQPVIADVDNDGNAEIVIAGNRSRQGLPGVRVYDDASDNWVRTRRIWNQHGYHVTNVSETGTVPAQEEPNWRVEGLNNFRDNVQGEGLFDAPDLRPDIEASTWECPLAFHFRITVRNEGALGVLAGLRVTLYEGLPDDPAPVPLATLITADPLLPGGSLVLDHRWAVPDLREHDTFSFFVRADDGGDGNGQHNECDEENNVAVLAPTQCESLCPPEVHEPHDELCNGVDDDCDGEVDEGLFRDCESACGVGFERCEAGAWVDCSALPPQPEVCDGRDQDCDGEIDEGDGLCTGEAPCVCGACALACPAGECVAADALCVDGWCHADRCPDGSGCEEDVCVWE